MSVARVLKKYCVWSGVLIAGALSVVVIGCTPKPFVTGALSSSPKQVPASDQRLLNDLEGVLDEKIGQRYKRAGSPSFALINGYYRLPTTKPFGAATIVSAYTYNTQFHAVDISEKNIDFAVKPLSGDDAIALTHAYNKLFDAGIALKEISLSDAVLVAQAEEQAITQNKSLLLQKVLPPSVDYLISTYPAQSRRGPVLIGRVIKNDGTLLAFRVVYHSSNKSELGRLIISLVEDTISRITPKK